MIIYYIAIDSCRGGNGRTKNIPTKTKATVRPAETRTGGWGKTEDEEGANDNIDFDFETNK